MKNIRVFYLIFFFFFFSFSRWMNVSSIHIQVIPVKVELSNLVMINRYMPSGLCCLNSLDMSFSNRRVVVFILCFIELPVFNVNSLDLDQTPRSVASDIGPHCLSMSVLYNTRHKWVTKTFWWIIGIWDFLIAHTSLHVNCIVHCYAYGLKIHITLMEIDQEIISTGILPLPPPPLPFRPSPRPSPPPPHTHTKHIHTTLPSASADSTWPHIIKWAVKSS